MDGAQPQPPQAQQQQEQSLAMVLAEVETALRTLLLGPPSPPSTVAMDETGSGKGRQKGERDTAAAAHRFLQVSLSFGMGELV